VSQALRALGRSQSAKATPRRGLEPKRMAFTRARAHHAALLIRCASSERLELSEARTFLA
jgi:hypothetical protein